MTKMAFNLGQKTFQGMKSVEQALRNKCVFVGLIILSAILHFAMLGFNALAGNPNWIKYGPFHHTIGEVSDMFRLPITPAGWAFSIWSIIYTLLSVTVLYSLVLICRHSNGQPAYENPIILSPLYFVLISLTSILNVTWLVLWDRLMLNASLIFLATIALTFFSALVIVVTRLSFFYNDFIDAGRWWEVTFLRVSAVNGLAMTGTWCTIAMLLNLAMAALYRWKLSVTPDNICLAIVAALFIFTIVYFTLDLYVLDPYTRYVLTPYITTLWGLAAILAKNWDPAMRSSILTAVLLAVTAIMAAAKLAFIVYRSYHVPNSYRRLTVTKVTSRDSVPMKKKTTS